METTMINQVVLEGQLARPAQDRELPSGSRLLNLEVTVRPEGSPAETVPVVWFDAPAWATGLDTGAGVIVIGRVRRRFFRATGSTQSRTEVVADRVLAATSVKRAKAALMDAGAALEAAAAAR
jgi:single-stranded DNA-binding protein